VRLDHPAPGQLARTEESSASFPGSEETDAQTEFDARDQPAKSLELETDR